MSTNSTQFPDSDEPSIPGAEDSSQVSEFEANDGDASNVEADIAHLFDQLQRLTDERDQMKEQVMRTMADFQNFRKRTQQESLLLRTFANEALVTALLPVLDNFERTVRHIDAGATLESVAEGVRAVERQLRSTLEGQGVVRIESVGKPFDPILHEALGTEPSELPPDTVTTELEAGYKMGDKVIRPARVKVTEH